MPTLYHVTPKNRVSQILRKGLVPTRTIPPNSQFLDKAVFLWVSLDLARESAEAGDFNNPVILGVTLPNNTIITTDAEILDPPIRTTLEKLFRFNPEDVDFLAAVMIPHTIGPSRITVVE